MDNQKLLEYINQSRQQGISDEQIKQNLVGNGWGESDVNQALSFGKKNKGMAVLAYLSLLIIIPLLIRNVRNDTFVKFHIKQGLVCFVLFISVNLGGELLKDTISRGVPSLSSVAIFFFPLFFSIAMIAIVLRGITNALSGKMRQVPIIGGLANWINF